MSALPPKADIGTQSRNVCFVPKADIRSATKHRSDEGKYSFRQWSTQVTAPQSGRLSLQVRCTNTKGESQPSEPNWNNGGFMRSVIERVQLTVG
jgi:hypothetical protein